MVRYALFMSLLVVNPKLARHKARDRLGPCSAVDEVELRRAVLFAVEAETRDNSGDAVGFEGLGEAVGRGVVD